jgi:hypothetical protein
MRLGSREYRQFVGIARGSAGEVCYQLLLAKDLKYISNETYQELRSGYIDLSCFNRPFGNQGQERIRRETQAVLDVLRRIVEGSDTLVWSWVLSFENDKHPKPDRRDEIAVWEARAERSIAVSADLEERARQIARQGIPALDAAHLASAEAGGAEIS